MHRGATFAAGIGGLIGLIVVGAGIPAGLAVIAGWPLPHSVPTLTEISSALTQQMSDEVITKAFVLVCWLAWAQMLWCLATEALAAIRHVGAHRVRAGAWTQSIAHRLVIAVIMLIGLLHRQDATVVSIRDMAPVVAVIEQQTSIPADAGNTDTALANPTCVVKARDDLWSLAERHLGNPKRWKEIYQLNVGVAQPDGRSLQNADLIHPGWVLRLPSDATGLEQTTVEPNNSDTSPQGVSSDTPSTDASGGTPGSSSAPQTEPQASTSTAPSVPSTPVSNDVENHENPDSRVPVGLLGTGLAAAGVVATLDRLRRRQQRRRPLDARIQALDPDLEETELVLRSDADMSGAQRLDLTLRALACCLAQGSLEETPVVDAIRVGDAGIEILFAAAVNAPAGPFEISGDGRVWTLDASVHRIRIGALATEIVATVPALATVGTVDGASVLVDLEAFGVTMIDGEQLAVRAMLGAIATELATSMWADHLNVIVVGDLPVPINLERIQRVENLNEVIEDIEAEGRAITDTLETIGFSSTLRARLINGTTEGWVPTVVICDSTDSAELTDRLLAVATGGRGIAVVMPGVALEENTARFITVSTASTWVRPPDIEVEPLVFDFEDVEHIASLLDVDFSADAYEPAVELAAPTPIIDVREPTTIATDLDAAEVRIEVLGNVQMSGNAKAIERDITVELVTYLALHPDGVSAERLKTALWPNQAPKNTSFNSTISRVRKCLGKARDGSHHLPIVTDGTKYRVGPHVVADTAVFDALMTRSKSASRDVEIDCLVKALGLVRGKPFDGCEDGFAWTHTESIVTHLSSRIADAAHRLALISLEDSNAAQARWAADKGILASPGYEPLYCRRMEALAAEGNFTGVESTMTELRHVLETDDMDILHPDTIALYKRLRPNRVVQAGGA